jgi:hypothetical protein
MEYDTDVNHYTDEEIFGLLEIKNETEVAAAADLFIEKYKNQPKLVKFYTDIKEKYESLGVRENENKNRLNSADHLNNTISRLINIDSTYREYSSTEDNNSTGYLFKLNEPIPNVVSLMLYSVEIPQSWYTFSEAKANTIFQLVLIAQNTLSEVYTDTSQVIKYEYPIIQINDGNYSSKALVNSVTELIRKSGIFVKQPNTFTLDQDVYTGRSKITITKNFTMSNIILPDGVSTIDYSYYRTCRIGFLFHSVPLKTKVNYNLGWLLGFRYPFVMLNKTFNSTNLQNPDTVEYSSSIVDTSGTKYIILQLDDFKTNRMNKSVVNISTKSEQTIALPSYYNRSLPQYQTSTTTVNVTANAIGLTEKQIYTINSINNSYNPDTSTIQISFPNISDIFAKIPIKTSNEWGYVNSNGEYVIRDSAPGKLLIEFSGPLQLATREYYGPVDLTTFSVMLYDDKGFPINLNGVDWSFTIISKSILNINI